MALLSPEAIPSPRSAFPASFIIDLTSAKSRFIRPGKVIKSVTPLTPLLKHCQPI